MCVQLHAEHSVRQPLLPEFRAQRVDRLANDVVEVDRWMHGGCRTAERPVYGDQPAPFVVLRSAVGKAWLSAANGTSVDKARRGHCRDVTVSSRASCGGGCRRSAGRCAARFIVWLRRFDARAALARHRCDLLDAADRIASRWKEFGRRSPCRPERNRCHAHPASGLTGRPALFDVGSAPSRNAQALCCALRSNKRLRANTSTSEASP